jgi:protoporphyrinogen/coproporphyrinogen III oxidase
VNSGKQGIPGLGDDSPYDKNLKKYSGKSVSYRQGGHAGPPLRPSFFLNSSVIRIRFNFINLSSIQDIHKFFPKGHTMPTIVIGAGISGLAAAHTLKKHHTDVLVLEAQNHAGGRTMGIRKDGFVLDYGAQFFMKCYDATLSLIRELGLEKDIVYQKHNAALWIDGKPASRSPFQDFPGFLKGLASPSESRGFGLTGTIQTARILLKILKRRKDLDFVDFDRALDFDREYFSEFVLRHGGKEALDYIFQPMIAGITLGNAEEIGALYGAALFWNLMRGNWVLKNGVHSLADKLYEKIESAVRLSVPVQRVVLENNRVKGVETRDGFIDADTVICATTATAARSLIPDLPGSLCFILDKVQYRPCCHVALAYDRRVIPGGFDVVSFPRSAGSTMAAIADSALTAEGYAPKGTSLIHCYTYDRFADAFNRMTDEEVLSRLTSELKTFLPTLPVNPIFSEIYRWKQAMCFAPPGMYEAVRRLKKGNGLAVDGLYFAGDYLNLASVEGSIHSGIQAAWTVCERK